MSYTEGITLVVAILGAVLGVVNTWNSVNQQRLRIRVTPQHAIPFGGADTRLTFCIQVTNLSSFPVTVAEVGFLYHGTTKKGAYIDPFVADMGPWPRRLEARESVTVYMESPQSLNGHRIKCAYVVTGCGERRLGTSGALKQIARQS